MELAVGEVLEGKITGITKFGAFVSLDGGRSGLVHISEVANTYVTDVHEFVQMGQTVKVRILSIGEDGRINLSIKRAEASPETQSARREQRSAPRPNRNAEPPARAQESAQPGNQEFEDRLKRFMQESDSRMADNREYSEHKQRNRRR